MTIWTSRSLGCCGGLALLTLLMTGCTPDTPDLAVLAEADETVMAAEIDGELRIDEQDCVYVGEWFTVWPDGANRTGDGVQVGDQPFNVGDRVHGMGGYLDRDFAKTLTDPDTASEMERCTKPDDEVAVLQLIE